MKAEFNKDNIRAAAKKVKPKQPVSEFPYVMKIFVEELKKCQTRIELLERKYEKLRLKLE